MKIPLEETAAIFSDEYGMRQLERKQKRVSRKKKRSSAEFPSLQDIVDFYQDFYKRSKMEHDTIIMSLIYVERLIKETDGFIVPVPENWKSLLFSCTVLASKVWDDMSMWNIDFSNVCGRGEKLESFTLTRINELELALLKSLNFNVKVRASEYAKYYFLIRSMLIKSGLLQEKENLKTPGERYLQELQQQLQQQQYPGMPQQDRQREENHSQPQPQKRKQPRQKEDTAKATEQPKSRRSHSFTDYDRLRKAAAAASQSTNQNAQEQLRFL